MPLKKSKYSTRHRANNAASKSDRTSLPSDLEKLQSICINDTASASTSNKSILLSEMDRRHDESLGTNRYPDIKNNNKSESISLNTSNESYTHKNILIGTPSNVKDLSSIEVDRSNNTERINIEGENVARRSERNLSRNEVPESCRLVILQNAACKTESISECLGRRVNLDSTPKTYSRKKFLSSVKPGTPSVEAKNTNVSATSRDSNINKDILHNSCTVEDNGNLINSKNVPDKKRKGFRQSKINDRTVSANNSSQKSIDDNILSTKVQGQIVKEQYGALSDERIARKNDEAKKIENKITALPVKPTRSLPSDLKASIEDSNKKSKLVKARNKSPSLMQSFTERMQSTIVDNDTKSTGECTELVTGQQISSEDKSMQKSVSEATDENNDLENDSERRDACTASEINVKHDDRSGLPLVQDVKRKRGRPRKTIDGSTDQSMPKKSKDDTSQETPITESIIRDKRRASKIRITTNMSDLSDESDIAEDEIIVKKRGRPPGSRGRSRGRGRRRGRGRGKGTSQSSLDAEYIPRLTTKDVSQSRTKESDKADDSSATTSHDVKIENAATDSNVPNSEKAVQSVTCAKCDQEVPKKQWSKHNLDRHNNMAWQKDEEPLDFENDIKLLRKVLALALKQKRKYLTCEKCETIKRSVNGFISHMQFCGKSEEERQALMVTCPLCQAIMMPSSMEVHERYHRQLEENKNKEVNNVQMEKTKRKAAERAVPKILELTESLKEQNFSMNNIIRVSASEKNKIPSAWKVMWKKEVSSGVVSCKQPGCTFTCSSYETICEHFHQCSFIPEVSFMCKICKFFSDTKDKVVDHIKEVHFGNNDLEKYSDYEIEEDENSSDDNIPEHGVKRKFGSRRPSKISPDSTRTCRKMVFLDKETTQNPQSTEAYKPALRWTLDFELKNYELELFKDDMPNCFTLLENNDAAMYFPELTASMAIKHVNVNLSKKMKNSDNANWKRMNRFEGDIYEAVPTFFVGGPIWALAWLPIPSPMFSKNPTQYVAISTHPTMECKYNVGNKYSGPNIIQIWDVGPLNHQVNNNNRSPILAYAIAHNSGTVWCLEWCPSGCYQDVDLGNYKADESKLKRMGLLAAACSDGCINIYSLPFADELKFEKTENNSWPIYKTDPVMTLVVNILMYENDKQDWQCTKLSWTKEHGHSILAAGFTNGYIALWHLPTTSPLLLNTRGNTKFISAFQYFFAHFNTITMVVLVPYGNSRFLASASVDKSYKFWNLEDTSAPQSCLKRGIISNGVWMTNWPCAVLSFDDALGYHYMHTLIVPLREYGYKHCPILATHSTTYGLAVSDHANGIAHGTLAGEVITIFPHQLLYTEKLLTKKRQLNSFIKTVDFLEKEEQSSKNSNSKDKKNSKEYHYMPETYDECKDRFGIIFHDNFVEVEKNIASGRSKDSLNTDKLMSVPIEQYPFTSINRMAWNPNARSYLWLATGYQNGLVRLLSLNFMSTPRELDALLPAHVKSMLAKKEAEKEQIN